MQEIHYVMKNMQLASQELSGNFAIVQNISQYLQNLPANTVSIEFLGSATDNIPVIIILNIKTWAFVSAFPFLR